MKLSDSLRLSVIVTVLLAAGAAHGFTPVHLDIQASTGQVASGYTALTSSNRWDNGTPVLLADGVKAAWVDAFGGGSRDRGATYPPLITDFLQITASNAPETLRITGLPASSYDLTLYATDPAFPDKETLFTIDQNNDGAADHSVTILNGSGQHQATVPVVVSAAGMLAITLDDAGGTGVWNGLDIVPGTPDTTPPAAVTDLVVTGTGTSTVSLRWTAPSDDPGGAAAASYDVRYSTSAIDEGNWASAMQATGEPAPHSPGQPQTFTVTGLTPQTTYFFAMRSADAAANVSVLSNVVSAQTQEPDLTAPAPVDDLTLTDVRARQVTLRWTATGDDGATGQATQYDLRYATAPIVNDTDFDAATQVAGEPAPAQAGATEVFTVTNLQPTTQYWFALKVLDDGEPANVSGLSNIATATTPVLTSIAYGISNGFSLAAIPSGGPYDPAVPLSSGDITITNIHVDRAQIIRRVDRSGAVHEGRLTFDVTSPTPDIFVWLELSTDGGATWNQRHIHAIGHVGPTQPGTGRTLRWVVDGDHGDRCKIRIRVNSEPATYSNFDADNNKFPRPAPWDGYPSIERLASKLDYFDFTNAKAQLPKIDFYKSIGSRGPVRAGFARVPYFDSMHSSNPPHFMHCCYLESADGQPYLILQADVKDVPATIVDSWRNQIVAAYGIPEDHIMLFWTHVHNNRPAADSLFPLTVIDQARASAVPVEVGFLNQDMGTSHNMHRLVMTDATHTAISYSNNPSDTTPALLPQWEFDAFGTIIGGYLDATPLSSVQTRFDCPQDSYLQMLVFRSAETHALRGIMVKFTGHPVMRDYWGDVGRHVMDAIQARVGAGVEVMYGCGYGGNHRFLAAQGYPLEIGSGRTANAFADALEAALPTMEFTPVTKVGVATGYDPFGRNDANAIGVDPERLGISVQAFALNDHYLSVLPSEAPSEQGLYVRARTSDLKHFYNAYGNNQLIYYYWGRFHSGTPNLYESFRMAQELVRSVNILEQSLDELRWIGDIDGDDHVNEADLSQFAASFGLLPGDAGYDAPCDFNGDEGVDVVDLLMMVENWGR